MVGAEAAVVLGIEREEQRARGHHRGEVRVVHDGREVARGLLGIAEVGEIAGAGEEAGVAGDGVGEGDTRVERTDEDGAPAAAGKTGHGHAFAVGVAVGQEHVERAGHGEIEGRDAAGAAEVELIHRAVIVAGVAQLSHAEPFHVQCDHAALGEVDAAKLFVARGFAGAVVAVDVQNDRDGAREVVRLVEEGGNPEARQGFVAQLANVITGTAGNRVEPFHPELGVAPGAGLTAEDDFFERVAAQFAGGLLPLALRPRGVEKREAALDVVLNISERLVRFEQRAGQRGGHGGGVRPVNGRGAHNNFRETDRRRGRSRRGLCGGTVWRGDRRGEGGEEEEVESCHGEKSRDWRCNFFRERRE